MASTSVAKRKKCVATSSLNRIPLAAIIKILHPHIDFLNLTKPLVPQQCKLP